MKLIIPHEPTLSELLNQTLQTRHDQAAVVCKPLGLSQAGILVLCVGEAATKKIGGCFLTFAKQQHLGDPVKIELEFQKSTADIFNGMALLNRGHSQYWGYGTAIVKERMTFTSPKIEVMVFVVTGTHHCVILAEELTKRGLSVSLS